LEEGVGQWLCFYSQLGSWCLSELNKDPQRGQMCINSSVGGIPWLHHQITIIILLLNFSILSCLILLHHKDFTAFKVSYFLHNWHAVILLATAAHFVS